MGETCFEIWTNWKWTSITQRIGIDLKSPSAHETLLYWGSKYCLYDGLQHKDPKKPNKLPLELYLMLLFFVCFVLFWLQKHILCVYVFSISLKTRRIPSNHSKPIKQSFIQYHNKFLWKRAESQIRFLSLAACDVINMWMGSLRSEHFGSLKGRKVP